MNDLITVIVPVYNVENYINHTLESLCGQTYQNLQILLIDDGSTDGSLSICQEWKMKDPRIKVYAQKNQGVAKTRNRGIELSSGKYVMFLDADDWIEADMLECLYHLAEADQADVACCELQEEQISKKTDNNAFHASLSEDGKTAAYEKYPVIHGKNKTESGLAMLKVWGPVCKLYRKELIETIRFETYKVAEDLLFNTNVICSEKFEKASLIEYPFYHYMIYSGSAMKQEFQKKYLDAMEVEELCYKKLTKLSPEFADINLIGCSVSRVFEKYAALPPEKKKQYKEDFRYCKKFAKQHKKELLQTKNRHRKISGWLKIYIPDIYLWILSRRMRG